MGLSCSKQHNFVGIVDTKARLFKLRVYTVQSTKQQSHRFFA